MRHFHVSRRKDVEKANFTTIEVLVIQLFDGRHPVVMFQTDIVFILTEQHRLHSFLQNITIWTVDTLIVKNTEQPHNINHVQVGVEFEIISQFYVIIGHQRYQLPTMITGDDSFHHIVVGIDETEEFDNIVAA